jgi:hypothetical protein
MAQRRQWTWQPEVAAAGVPIPAWTAPLWHPWHAGRASLRWLIGSQIDEIGADPVLRVYGAGLALLHVLTFLFWRQMGVESLAAHGAEPICWPLVSNCASLRVLSADQLHWLLRAYCAAALLVAPLFLRRRLVPYGYAGLIALSALKLLVLALDYRLRLNQHYMAFWATAVFLFVPGKRDALRVLLVLFYFWAGTLKLNWEWISGAALYRPLWLITGSGVVAACAYVVVLELVVSWGLLAERAWIFWAALAQVALFHVMSWAIVDFFYPLLMFLLILVFPLGRLWPPAGAPRGLLRPLLQGRLRAGTYVTAAAFSLFQLFPYTLPGDRAITGEGRLYALHMFDARIVCDAHATVLDRNGLVRDVDLRIAFLPRIDCDPIVAYNRARNLCEGRSSLDVAVVDLDLHLAARRTTDAVLHEVVNLPSFCRGAPPYRSLRHNAWIQTDGRAAG